MLQKPEISAGLKGHLARMQTLPRHKQFQFRISHCAREGTSLFFFFYKRDRSRDEDSEILVGYVKYHSYKAANKIVAEHYLAGVIVEILVTS